MGFNGVEVYQKGRINMQSCILTKRNREIEAKIQQEKPATLWHTTPKKLSVLTPSKNDTMYREFGGKFVFATSDEIESYAYIMHGATGLYMGGYGEEPEKIFCLLKNREVFLKVREKYPSYIYTIPSDSFRPVISRNGSFDNEWISKRPVPVIESLTKYPRGIEDVLQKGIQVFFLQNPGEYENVFKHLKRMKYGYQQWLQIGEMAREGIVIHENEIRNIRPEKI